MCTKNQPEIPASTCPRARASWRKVSQVDVPKGATIRVRASKPSYWDVEQELTESGGRLLPKELNPYAVTSMRGITGGNDHDLRVWMTRMRDAWPVVSAPPYNWAEMDSDEAKIFDLMGTPVLNSSFSGLLNGSAIRQYLYEVIDCVQRIVGTHLPAKLGRCAVSGFSRGGSSGTQPRQSPDGISRTQGAPPGSRGLAMHRLGGRAVSFA